MSIRLCVFSVHFSGLSNEWSYRSSLSVHDEVNFYVYFAIPVAFASLLLLLLIHWHTILFHPTHFFFVCFGPPVKFYLIREKLFFRSRFLLRKLFSAHVCINVYERDIVFRITFTCWLFDCTQNGRNYSAGGSRLHVKVACTSDFHCHGFQLSLWPSFNEHAE